MVKFRKARFGEAAMCAGFYKADNLIAFVDNNNLQLDGSLEEVMSPYPIGDKFKAFGWNVIEIDGHDVEQIADAVELASVVTGKPTAIVAHTIKGKGVSLFENNVDFHGGQPKPEQWPACFAELMLDLRNWRTDKMGENISTRVAYGRALAEFGADENIYVFDADLKKCTMTL